MREVAVMAPAITDVELTAPINCSILVAHTSHLMGLIQLYNYTDLRGHRPFKQSTGSRGILCR
jgi:hypothetical protein